MILRPYQQTAVSDIRRAYASGCSRVIYVLATGGGKTVTFSHIAAAAAAKGNRTWIVAHRQELVHQASRTLKTFGVDHGIIMAGITPNPLHTVHVASIQTLGRKLGKITPPDFIVFDECHHATSGSYMKTMEAYPQAKILGVTATPCRTDGKGLGDVFQTMIQGITTAELTEQGYLAHARYYAPPQIVKLEGIRRRGGDYARDDLEAALADKAITGDAVQHYRTHGDGKPAIVFCVSVAHARSVAEQYLQAGYSATSVDGTLDDSVRAERIQGLGTGKYHVLTSCDLIGEGLDIPSVTIAQLLRPTQSLSLHLQQIGRSLRPADGKEHAIILDHVGNCSRHGFATTDQEWTLEGVKKRTHKESIVAISTCSQCYACYAPAPQCPYCGFTAPTKNRVSKTQIVAGTLTEITPEVKRQRKEEEAKATTMGELIKLGKERGYKNPAGWAFFKLKSRRNHDRKGHTKQHTH